MSASAEWSPNSPREEYTKQLLAVRTYQKVAAFEGAGDVVLKVDNVTAAYGNKIKVLEDVSIEIHRAKTVAIVGESGSGKSTLARVVTGLLPPLAGQVTFMGEVMASSFRNSK